MLTLICGISNAGKTTYSSKYKNTIHLDDFKTVKEVCSIVQKEKEKDVCVQGIFCLSRHRKQLCNVYNGNKICIWLNTPLEECISRENRNRSQLIIKNGYEIFEPPTYKQGWDQIIIIENDKETILDKEE